MFNDLSSTPSLHALIMTSSLSSFLLLLLQVSVEQEQQGIPVL
jgi:hypothetical protein